jgi:GTPase Era involved in 16S rRNA processing
MSNFFTVCVGEVGAGKSTFINSLLKYGNKNPSCKTGRDWKGVTKELDEKFITKGNNNFYFIDTPGLNEANLSEEMIQLLKNEISGNIEKMSRIRCILIIMKITDYRLTNDMQKILIELMNTFPCFNFWEKHVLVIRTHCFDESQINNIQGNIEQIIKEDPKIKETMNKKGIKLPEKIKEFYVNSVDKNGNYNSDKIGDILNEITKTDPLYQNIKYSDIKERHEGKIKIKYKIMTYQDFGKDESHSVEIQTDVIGADDNIDKKVGSPYKRTCKKGYWQDYQKYYVKYDKNGEIENEVPIGSKFTKQV